jgi:hypothetical protein
VNSRRSLALVFLYACLAGCTEPNLKQRMDAGDTGGGGDGGAGLEVASQPQVVVSFSGPGADVTHVRGVVTLQIAVEGARSDRVALRVDGTPLATLAPPFQYEWDTVNHAEGDRQVTAEAFEGEAKLGEATRDFVVDRTPPTISLVSPAAEHDEVDLASPLRLKFSEAIAPELIPSAVSVQIGGESAEVVATLSDDGTELDVRVVGQVPPLPAEEVLSLSAEIHDFAGWPLAAQSWTFSAPTWLPISLPETYDEIRDVAARSDMLWLGGWHEESPTGPYAAYVSKRQADGSWQPETVHTQTDSISYVRLAMAANGRAAMSIDTYRIDEWDVGRYTSALFVRASESHWEPLPEHLYPEQVIDEVAISADGSVSVCYEDSGVRRFAEYRDGAWRDPLAGMPEVQYAFARLGNSAYAIYRDPQSAYPYRSNFVLEAEGGWVPAADLSEQRWDAIKLSGLDDGRVVLTSLDYIEEDFGPGWVSGLLSLYTPGAEPPAHLRSWYPTLGSSRLAPLVFTGPDRYFVATEDGVFDMEGRKLSTEAAGRGDRTLVWNRRPVVFYPYVLSMLNLPNDG